MDVLEQRKHETVQDRGYTSIRVGNLEYWNAKRDAIYLFIQIQYTYNGMHKYS